MQHEAVPVQTGASNTRDLTALTAAMLSLPGLCKQERGRERRGLDHHLHFQDASLSSAAPVKLFQSQGGGQVMSR